MDYRVEYLQGRPLLCTSARKVRSPASQPCAVSGEAEPASPVRELPGLIETIDILLIEACGPPFQKTIRPSGRWIRTPCPRAQDLVNRTQSPRP